jgi:hypothetical protein
MALVNNMHNTSRPLSSDEDTFIIQNQSWEFLLTSEIPAHETALINNTQEPPAYDNFPPTLDGVKQPSIWGRAWYYGVRTTYRLHILPIQRQTDVRCIYQRGRLEVYTLDSVPENLGLVTIGYLETQTLLQHVQVWHVVTWIPPFNNRKDGSR